MTIAPNPDPAVLTVGTAHLASIARHIQTEVDRRITDLKQSTSGLRQVTIASRDPTTLTCRVYLDGDTTIDAPCRPIGTHVVPIVGQEGWAIQNGTDLILTGMREASLPKARLSSHNTNSTVTTEVDWDFNVSALQYDTDWDGTQGMFNSAGGNLIARWPGYYEIGAHGFALPSAGSIVPVMLLQALGGTFNYDADQNTSHGTNGIHLRIVTERFFDTGQGIQLRIRSSGGSSAFGDTDLGGDLGMVMWMSYKP